MMTEVVQTPNESKKAEKASEKFQVRRENLENWSLKRNESSD